MFGFLSEGALAFWVIMAVGWVLVKLFEVEPKPDTALTTFPREDFDPNIPSGVLDHFTVLESYRDENLMSTIRLRNDITGQVVTLTGGTEHAARVEAFALVNQWRNSDYQLVV